MAQMQKGCHSLMIISLFMLEFVFFSSVDGLQEILLSRNFSCGSKFNLSSQIDSYKITFPEDETSRLCDVYSKKWVCRVNFQTDTFIQSSFELCFDPTNQKIRNCDDAHIYYDTSYDNGLMTQFCTITYPMKCLRKDKKLPIVFFEYLPCSFSGSNHVFLRPRHDPTYVLFKEYRHCSDNGYSLEEDSGRVVSEFDHRIQKWSHFCPLHIGVNKGKEYSKFCFWSEYVSFGNNSTLSITVSSVDGEFELIFNRSHAKEKRYCENARPEGYVISAVIDGDDFLNDHRLRLKYRFTEKVDIKEGYGGNADDEVVVKEDDNIFPVPFWVILLAVGILMVIIGVGFYSWYIYSIESRRRRRQQQQEEERRRFSDPLNIPLYRPTSLYVTTTIIRNSAIFGLPGEDDFDSHSLTSPSVAPSAPRMEERRVSDDLPPAYPAGEEGRVLDESPPSYDALFNTNAS